MQSCCFTGYRPGKFHFSLEDGKAEYERLKADVTEKLLEVQREGCTVFYTGCAMGFDLIAAEAALWLRDRYKAADFQVVCAIPFAEQALRYPKCWRDRYERVLACADRVVLLSDHYFHGCYQQRNRWMVDRSDVVLTWFDGQPGGTKNTLDYAKKQKKQIVNLADASTENAMYPLPVD